MKCPKCGEEIADGSTFCTNCGEQLSSGSTAAQPDAAAPQTSAQQPAPEDGKPAPEKEPKKKQQPEKTLEELTRPVGMLRYFVMFLALAVPILNIVMLFKWGFGWGVNKNVRNFARGALLYALVMLALTIFIWVVWPEFFSGIFGFFEKIAALKLVANS